MSEQRTTFRMLVELLREEYEERMAQGLSPRGGPREAELYAIVTAPPRRSRRSQVARVLGLGVGILAISILGFGLGALVWAVIYAAWL